MNYYQFHVGDYISHTAHLEPLEDLAFRRLLDMYYQTESGIPNETQMVSKRIRLAGSDQIVASVLSEFFTLGDDNLWHHTRCDKEISAYQAKSERNRLVGKLGGRPRLQDKNPKETQMVNSGNPNETLTKNQEPRTINQEPIKSVGRKRPSTKRPDDWRYSEKHKEMADQFGLVVSDQCQRFIDWSDSKAAVYADWDAAFRTWLRKSKDMQPAAGRHAGFDRRDYSEGVRDDGKF